MLAKGKWLFFARLRCTQGRGGNHSQERKTQKQPRGQGSLAYNVSLSMTNDTASLLLSVPEDTYLNRTVQTCIEICVTLEDISIHLTGGCWLPSQVLIFWRNCEMTSSKWWDGADGPTVTADGSEKKTHGDAHKLHVVFTTSRRASLWHSLSSPLTLSCQSLTLKEATKSIHHGQILKRGEN